MYKRLSLALFITLVLLLSLAIPVNSADFNPNFILGDADLLDYTSMTDEDEVQQFLRQKGGFLAYYVDVDTDGQIKRASDIVWRASQTFKINPKFLLALLQKEQGLVEDQRPTERQYDWAAGYGACDGCLLAHPLVQKYKGFGKQVYYAAERIRNTYLADIENRGKTHTGIGPGVTSMIDRQKITPVNVATAVLYTYTPHINGNKNLWRIWNRWFAKYYPDGSLLQDQETGGIWLIQLGKKRPFLSKAAFFSRYDINKVIPVAGNVLDLYETYLPIRFPEYSLLRLPEGKIYLTMGDIARPIASEQVFRTIGYHPEEVIDIITDDLLAYQEGAPITLESVYPLGALLQNNKTGGVYYMEEGKKHPIWSRELLRVNFSGRRIIQVSPDELEKYETAEPILFPDGELVRAFQEPAVYYISDGKRRSIPSAEIFEAYGWKWENIIWTSQKALSLHPLGESINLTTPKTETKIKAVSF